MNKVHVAVTLLCCLLSLFLNTEELQAIDVVVVAQVFAPTCCGAANVRFITSLTISQPEPAWHQQPYFWSVTTGRYNCNPNFRLFDLGTEFSGNNIGSGVFRLNFQAYSYQSCPVAAKSTSEAWVGGYGLLPLVMDEDSSFCEMPCYCLDV